MRATTEPVEGNKVRLSVEIDEPDVDKVLDEMVRDISRQARIPGFRPGKVPRQVLEARMGGAGALRAEALREALPDFYAQAVAEAGVEPIASPEIDITSGEEGGAVAFDAVVEVRPIVAIPGYAGLRVTLPSPRVADEEIEAQLERMRETEAELVEVGRSAVDRDNVTIDVHGTDGGGQEVMGADDFLYEVGSGRVVPELDEQLRGAKVGDILAFSATPEGAGPVSFRVLVKDVKEKKLPQLTDEWASESSEFDTVEALRADLTERMGQVKVVQAQLALREKALDELSNLVDDDEVPEVLVDDEVRQRVHDLNHRLEEQRLTIDQLLAATGRTGEELVAEVRVEAARAVKADLALRALAEAEGLVVDDEDLTSELSVMAERMEIDLAELRERLDHAGRTAAVRSEQKKAKAMTWLIDHVELVDDEGNPISREELAVDQGAEGEDSDDEGAAPRTEEGPSDQVGTSGEETEG